MQKMMLFALLLGTSSRTFAADEPMKYVNPPQHSKFAVGAIGAILWESEAAHQECSKFGDADMKRGQAELQAAMERADQALHRTPSKPSETKEEYKDEPQGVIPCKAIPIVGVSLARGVPVKVRTDPQQCGKTHTRVTVAAGVHEGKTGCMLPEYLAATYEESKVTAAATP
jgi:hypothetical protein